MCLKSVNKRGKGGTAGSSGVGMVLEVAPGWRQTQKRVIFDAQSERALQRWICDAIAACQITKQKEQEKRVTLPTF